MNDMTLGIYQVSKYCLERWRLERCNVLVDAVYISLKNIDILTSETLTFQCL